MVEIIIPSIIIGVIAISTGCAIISHTVDINLIAMRFFRDLSRSKARKRLYGKNNQNALIPLLLGKEEPIPFNELSESTTTLTKFELLSYDGTNDDYGQPTPLYLSIAGRIYDVSKGGKFYGPGGKYHKFVGKDATRAFATGCLRDDCFDDTQDDTFSAITLSDNEKKEIRRWLELYETHDKYVFIGHLLDVDPIDAILAKDDYDEEIEIEKDSANDDDDDEEEDSTNDDEETTSSDNARSNNIEEEEEIPEEVNNNEEEPINEYYDEEPDDSNDNEEPEVLEEERIKIDITFENNGNEAVIVYWVNDIDIDDNDNNEENEEEESIIEPGESQLFDTYHGHKFIFKAIKNKNSRSVDNDDDSQDDDDEELFYLMDHIVDINNDGGNKQHLIINEPISIKLENNYNIDDGESIILYYLTNNDENNDNENDNEDEEEERKIYHGQINPGEYIDLTTYHGHVFSYYSLSNNKLLGKLYVDRTWTGGLNQHIMISEINDMVSITFENQYNSNKNDNNVADTNNDNNNNNILVYYYDDETNEEIYQGQINYGKKEQYNTYHGHKYIFKSLNDNKVIDEYVVVNSRSNNNDNDNDNNNNEEEKRNQQHYVIN